MPAPDRSVAQNRIALLWCAVAFGAVVLLAGCRGDSGEPRYDLSGNVTYEGTLVPAGRILFSPDASQGNEGPATVADITNGRYRTRPGKGAVAGPHMVRIIGADETMATETHDNSLFTPYETQVIVDEANTSHDFVVPAAAGASIDKIRARKGS